MDLERKKTVSQVEEIDASCLPPVFELQTRLVKATFIISLLIGLVLLSFDLPSGNGKRVTPRIFQGCPSVFEAFVICVIFSFTCSFNWLFIRNKPKFTTFRRFYFIISMVFMALALSILSSALFSRGSRLWNWNPGNFSSISLPLHHLYSLTSSVGSFPRSAAQVSLQRLRLHLSVVIVKNERLRVVSSY